MSIYTYLFLLKRLIFLKDKLLSIPAQSVCFTIYSWFFYYDTYLLFLIPIIIMCNYIINFEYIRFLFNKITNYF